MKMRLPDFIIGGAARSATTWLYHAADKHPDIAMAKPVTPEPKFFLVDDLYAKGLRHYSATWFEPLPAAGATGEKSTNYLESRTACLRIARDLPDVRLVFLLRNPAERAYSNYLWSKRNGLETESFARALELESARESTLKPQYRYARPFSYFSRGLYAEMLEPWLQHFQRQNILVLRSKDVAHDPRAVVERLHEFLGVAPLPAVADELGIINSARTEETLPGADRSALENLCLRYRESNVRLAGLLGPEYEDL